VNCSACGHENREGSRFCEECGAPFAVRCARCDTELPGKAKFCPECGAARAGAPAEAPAPRAPISFASGRYRVKRLLGEGAKKRVYLARDERDTAWQVASAVINLVLLVSVVVDHVLFPAVAVAAATH